MKPAALVAVVIDKNQPKNIHVCKNTDASI